MYVATFSNSQISHSFAASYKVSAGIMGHLRVIGYNHTQEATSNFKLQLQTDQLL